MASTELRLHQRLSFSINAGGGDDPFSAQEQMRTNAPFPTNQWVHVAVTVEPDPDAGPATGLFGITGRSLARIYIDGVEQARQVFSRPPAALLGMNNNFLGRAQEMSYPTFNGRLDDVRVYPRSLNAARSRRPGAGKLATRHPGREWRLATRCAGRAGRRLSPRPAGDRPGRARRLQPDGAGAQPDHRQPAAARHPHAPDAGGRPGQLHLPRHRPPPGGRGACHAVRRRGADRQTLSRGQPRAGAPAVDRPDRRLHAARAAGRRARHRL
jgi:hypothetical protein